MKSIFERQRILMSFVAMLSIVFSCMAQPSNHPIRQRIRVIVDNDFGGDPDGLFMMAHLLLSPSIELKGVIASQHYKDFYGQPGNVDYSKQKLEELLDTMNLQITEFPIVAGQPAGIENRMQGISTQASEIIINEANRTDTKAPLYILCGAGLTNIANALLIDPDISARLTLVWIGGPEYPEISSALPLPQREYNLGIDPLAAQVVFNDSNVPIWQIPRDAYRQCLMSYYEMISRVKSTGPTGNYLVNQITDLMRRAKGNLGETYALGDSPLVLLTALQCSWDKDPTSSRYTMMPRPCIDDNGRYVKADTEDKVRVFTHIDNRLMFEDMIAKLLLSSQPLPTP